MFLSSLNSKTVRAEVGEKYILMYSSYTEVFSSVCYIFMWVLVLCMFSFAEFYQITIFQMESMTITASGI